MASPRPTFWPAPASGSPLIDAMTHGYSWMLGPERTIDWSISGGFAGETWVSQDNAVNALTAAFDFISYYVDVRFNYVGSFGTPVDASLAGSEINVGLDGANRFFGGSRYYARGIFPNDSRAENYPGETGDILLNMDSPMRNLPLVQGGTGFALLLHEIGHVLGLKHPHDDGGTGRPTFVQIGASTLDREWLTIMSYAEDYAWNRLQWHPASPMALDVIALQAIYGVNPTTNNRNGTYALKDAGVLLTVWDAAGFDTIDLSDASAGWHVQLPAPVATLSLSSLGMATPLAQLSLSSPQSLYWLAGDYERVIGGVHGDRIVGGAGDNWLYGGGGADTISDPGGSNVIRGEDGDDLLTGGDGFDDMHGNAGNDTLRGGGGNDWVVGGKDNDLLYGEEGDDIVYGNLGDDTLSGGPGVDWVRGGQGDDSISGGPGDDLIWGDRGDDTISGGSGADIFGVFAEAGIDRILDFNGAEGDRIRVENAGWKLVEGAEGAVIQVEGGAQVILVGVRLEAFSLDWVIA